jgi:hypothetical protein
MVPAQAAGGLDPTAMDSDGGDGCDPFFFIRSASCRRSQSARTNRMSFLGSDSFAARSAMSHQSGACGNRPLEFEGIPASPLEAFGKSGPV